MWSSSLGWLIPGRIPSPQMIDLIKSSFLTIVETLIRFGDLVMKSKVLDLETIAQKTGLTLEELRSLQ